MLITDDLLKALDDAFPMSDYDHAKDWATTCQIQGGRQVIDWLKATKEEMNAEAIMVSGEESSMIVAEHF